GGAVTVRVPGPVLNAQLEAGAFATSYIPTTAAAVTRAPDLGTMPTAPWFNATAGSAAAVITLISWSQPSGNNNCCVFTFDDGAGNRQNAIDLIAFTNAATFMQANAAVRVANVVTGSLSYTNLNLTGVPVSKMAIAWGGPTVAQAVNGGVAQSGALTGLPTISRLNIGYGFAAVTPIAGYMRQLTYWPRALSSTELQQVTT